MEQLLTNDPDHRFPNEIWLQQVQPGEFAVRYQDYKTGTRRSPDGKRPGSSEKCRIFSTLEEARSDSRAIASSHAVVVCVIYNQEGSEVARIRNDKEIGKFAAISFLGFLIWGTVLAAIGMASLWIIYRLALSLLALWRPGVQPIRSLPWFGWIAFAVAGISSMIYAWYLRLRFVTSRRTRRVLNSIKPEERERFRAINDLHSTTDPVERERLLKLYREYQDRLQQALKEHS